MPSKVTVRRGWFPEADLRRFLSSARDELELLWWVLMCDAGLRSGEVRRLRWADLEGRAVRVKGKGRKVRLVPITRRIEKVRNAVLTRYPFPSDHLICKISARSLQRRFDFTLTRSRIRKEKLCPHSLRHTFATRLLAAGVDIHRVGVLLGHSSTLTTVGYLHTNEEALSDARDRLDKLNEGPEPPRGAGQGSEAGEKAEGDVSPIRSRLRTYDEIGDLSGPTGTPDRVVQGQTIRVRPSPLDRLDSLI